MGKGVLDEWKERRTSPSLLEPVSRNCITSDSMFRALLLNRRLCGVLLLLL